ncbi:FAD-binding oxidoreductase [Actinoallomurus sp. CA-142502]|uniref:FAD-binding oxidoreductase n=1 Tax=Actinoallomurus sp. CA-142502 TaxID=3239885 RepID=UPI003D8AE638
MGDRRETRDVVTFVVKRIDDRLVRTSLPGQNVTVRLRMPDGVLQPRQYNLTRADDGAHRQFSVKRVEGGDGRPPGEISTLLHDSVDVGDMLTLSLPYGNVVLDDSGRPAVFASAGIGITPVAGMLSHLAQVESRPPITMLDADLEEAVFPLRRQVVNDVVELPHAELYVWYENDAHGIEPVNGVFHGTMDLSVVDLPDNAIYYLCGPLPFMRALRGTLLTRGVVSDDIHYEVFGPDLWQADLE